jgi:hypothetical protein
MTSKKRRKNTLTMIISWSISVVLNHQIRMKMKINLSLMNLINRLYREDINPKIKDLMKKRRENMSTNQAPNRRNKTTTSSFHVKPTPRSHSKLERSQTVSFPHLPPTKRKKTTFPKLLSKVDKAGCQMLQRNPIQVRGTTKKHILKSKKSNN